MLRSVLLAPLVLLLCTAAGARVFTLVEGEPSLLNAWPAADGLLGTGDDMVLDAPHPFSGCEPNGPASWSYFALDMLGDGVGSDTDYLPDGFTTAAFVGGVAHADPAVGESGGGPLLTGLHLEGTRLLAGADSFGFDLRDLHGGSYDPASGAFAVEFDLKAVFADGFTEGDGLSLSGSAWMRDAADFGVATGDAYFDDVLIPLAQGLGATGLLFVAAEGVVPDLSGGGGYDFSGKPCRLVLVGVATADTPAATTSWGAVKALY